MKFSPTTHEERRTFTLEQAQNDYKPENVEYKNGLPELPIAYVRRALMNNYLFSLDVMGRGFPTNVTVLPTDSAEMFDVVVTWSRTY